MAFEIMLLSGLSAFVLQAWWESRTLPARLARLHELLEQSKVAGYKFERAIINIVELQSTIYIGALRR